MSDKNAVAITEKKFLAAIKYQSPPFNWIPPEKPPLQVTPNPRKPFSNENLPDCNALQKREFEARPGDDELAPSHGKKELDNLPHPFSNFSHIDPDEENPASKSLKNEAAYQRLKLAFDFIVCRTHTLLAAINEALINDSPADYRTARRNYITFVQNLDNHEPNEDLDEEDVKKGLGYGKHFRWIFVDPIVEVVKTSDGDEMPLITGTTIILKWNPHSSSSGIPIYP